MKRLLSFLFILFLTSCGSFETLSLNDSLSTPATPIESTDSSVFIFATDYASSGQLYQATLTDNKTELLASNMTSLGTEAMIQCNEDYLYILHAGGLYNSISSDNLQIVTPFDDSDPYQTIAQYSTGNATNPQDVLVMGTDAYITLDYPEADSSLIDTNNRPLDVIQMDLSTGEIRNGFSFYNWMNNDDEHRAHANKLLRSGNTLYIALQDYDLIPEFTTNAAGKIGMINLETNQVSGVLNLTCRNPSGMVINPDATKLFVSCVDDYTYATDYSGLQVINLPTFTKERFLSDSTLGGYIEKIRLGPDSLLAVVAAFDPSSFTFQSKIISLPYTLTSFSQATTLVDWGSDIRDFVVDGDILWVSYRTISTTEGDHDPSVRAYDVATGGQIGETLYPAVAGVSLCVPREQAQTLTVQEGAAATAGAITTEIITSPESEAAEEAVDYAPEDPQDTTDRFLNNNDTFSDHFGADSGFGYADFPDILFGKPDGTYDVVSFGTGGQLTIELGGFLIVDGDGTDFTVFENPFTGWAECAEVAVSQDGIRYVSFTCDQDDTNHNGLYEGCAGAIPVVTGLTDAAYLNPTLSGGDPFDLSTLGSQAPDIVQFIRITDIGRCPSTASTVPSATSAGFDMDAMAIIHGINE